MSTLTQMVVHRIVARLVPIIAVGLVALAGCASRGNEASGESGGAAASEPAVGITSEPTTIAATAPAGSPSGSEPTASSSANDVLTIPRDATAEIETLLGSPGPSVELPEQLAQAVADALVPSSAACEAGPTKATVLSVTRGEPAVAVVEVRVGCDDSVAGSRYVLQMEPDDSSGWAIGAATRQDICRRGGGGAERCV